MQKTLSNTCSCLLLHPYAYHFAVIRQIPFSNSQSFYPTRQTTTPFHVGEGAAVRKRRKARRSLRGLMAVIDAP
ncbi:hypothetical protein I656_01035 [Geobacillus sp. WSUCF1]|nr:hypothetical protein I656_01035 [Geobacillus sp. WSUCF1]